MHNDNWHALNADAALTGQGSTSAGLNATEAAQRLAAHGPNRLTPPKKRGPFLRFLLQFHNVLIYVLLGAAVVTALLGHGVCLVLNPVHDVRLMVKEADLVFPIARQFVAGLIGHALGLREHRASLVAASTRTWPPRTG